MTGTDVQNAITDLATMLGYMVHHETDSRRTNPGYPDLTIVGHGAVFFIECKGQKEKLLAPRTVTRQGRQHVLPGQRDWIDAMSAVADESAGTVYAFVCRPKEIDEREADGVFTIGLDQALELLAGNSGH